MAESTEQAGPGPQLDADVLIDEILAKKGPARYKDGLSEDNWEEELEQIPLFMSKTPSSVDPDKSPGLAALQALKYEMETAEGRANAYKEEGNEYFRVKKYKEAMKEYSAGIKEKSNDDVLNAVLYTNRAAAHFYIGNYRSSLMDATQAKKIKPDHIKALVRGALTCTKLQRYGEAIQWCDEGLVVAPDNARLKELRREATKERKRQERDARKQAAHERSKKKDEDSLLEAIKSRGVSLVTENERGSDRLALTGPHPSGGHVHFNESGQLVWPVLFLYPEHGQSDFIEAFNENDRICDHLDAMFGRERAPWDRDGNYTPTNIAVYFEYAKSEKLKKVEVTLTLGDVLQMKGYYVSHGTPAFILLAADSAFSKQYISGRT